MTSKSYRDRLNSIIPGGAHTYSRGHDQFPYNVPEILDRAQGAYVWSPDGKRFLDYGMALRAVTIGYADKRVNNAAISQIHKGNNLTRASTVELEAAELLVDTIPSAGMVKFAKNGSNVTTAAAKVARAYTGRQLVCVPRQHPFFSFDDWFIGKTQVPKGVPVKHSQNTLLFDYNDLASLERLFSQYPGQIAAVMLEPATTITPCSKTCSSNLSENPCVSVCKDSSSNFLLKTQNLCKQNGALFILDEMITGFRWSLTGAQTYFGVEPDLSTFGKAMANGFSLAALVGKKEIMEVGSIERPGAERTFLLSSTHGGEMCSLGAFIETVKIYKDEDVCGRLWKYGTQLSEGIKAEVNSLGLNGYFDIVGPAICQNFEARNLEKQICPLFRTLFSQEMAKNNVIMSWISVSAAHGEVELDITLSAVRKSLKVYKQALDSGIGDYLVGDPVKPVFRRYN